MCIRDSVYTEYFDTYRHQKVDLPDYNVLKANEFKTDYPGVIGVDDIKMCIRDSRKIVEVAKPGMTTKELNEVCKDVLADGLMKLGLIKNSVEILSLIHI